MEKTEIIIREDGTITERTIHERDLEAEDSVLDALTAEVTRPIHNVMHFPDWGMAHASIGVDDTYWSVPIDRIPLDARFRVINGVLVPVFASNHDPQMPLIWFAPKDVHLVFVTRTVTEEGVTRVGGNWLFAYNKEHNGFRLPLPNLHDDCAVCMGGFKHDQKSACDCVAASLEQFRKSKWNADLMRTAEQSQKFFRFHPTNEKFETLAIDAADWTTLCDKVSTSIMERILL
jgi:hypothetical protein